MANVCPVCGKFLAKKLTMAMYLGTLIFDT